MTAEIESARIIEISDSSYLCAMISWTCDRDECAVNRSRNM
jgi:hypothetical protein